MNQPKAKPIDDILSEKSFSKTLKMDMQKSKSE